VIGGIEVWVSEELSGGYPPDVPVADSCGFYIQNMAVHDSYRRMVCLFGLALTERGYCQVNVWSREWVKE